MGLAEKVVKLFSSRVRKRGQAYFAVRRVALVTQENVWASFQVTGSGGHVYDVLLDWGEQPVPLMECTCPYFQGGDYCKHLWAAILATDKLGLADLAGMPTAPSIGRSFRPAERSSPSRLWLQQLGGSSGATRPGTTAGALLVGSQQRYYYLLETGTAGELPVVSVYQQDRLKNGNWGAIRACEVDHATLSKMPPSPDRTALSLLLGNRVSSLDERNPFFSYYRSYRTQSNTRVELTPPLFDTVLPKLAETGRLVYLAGPNATWADARPLRWEGGPAWTFQIRAEPSESDDGWNLRGELVRLEQRRPLAEVVCWFSSGLILIDDFLAPFDCPADWRWLDILCREESLWVPAEDREALMAELWSGGEPIPLVGDQSLTIPGVVGTPRGRLIVHPTASGTSRTLDAELSFLYGEHEVTLGSDNRAWCDESTQQMVVRDEDAELDLLLRLFELNIKPSKTGSYGPFGKLQVSANELPRAIRELLEQGWEVHAHGSLIRKSGSLSLSIRSDVDWFDLAGEASFEGVSIGLPDLLKALRRGDNLVRLGDGTSGLLPEDWLSRYAPLADLAREQQGDALRFQPGQALLLDSLLAANGQANELKVDRRFAALRKRLKSFAGIKPARPPRAFRGELRQYQQEGLGWLRFLEKFGFGGCLADDMGLGKTVQVLALLASRNGRSQKDEPRPSLVVAPNSVVHNWRLEAERFSPRLRVAEYTGIDRKKRVADFTQYDLLLTTYGTLRQDFERLGEVAWDYVILDEAQAIKNAASQTAKASRLLEARHRLALSGTPVENHLGELWSIFEFINPGLLGRGETFKGLGRNGSQIDDEQIQSLRKGLAPFLLRRTKAQVLPQLPPKSEQRLYCDLPPLQRKQYNQLRDHYRQAISQRIADTGLAKSKIHVLEALLRLRQAACHPGLIDPKYRGKSSAKLDLLVEQLTEVVQEGHKALVFSQFTSLLDIVKRTLDKAGIVYEYLDGQTRDRQARVERFQNDPACPVFLISLKAGGSGLNLTAADYVFLLDPWWNPAVEAQAIDRTHRIGQTRPVLAYRLIARDTVEEKILELQEQKRSVADAIISADSSLLKNLTADDLQAIFS